MASETEFSPEPSPSFIENLIATRNREFPLFLLPFILGHNTVSPPHESPSQAGPFGRILLIHPFIIESNNNFGEKSGRLPASKASIEAMETVEVEKDHGQCVICLEDWEIGEKARKMPCGHMFHEECVERWLKIRGSCPVCRYEMPVEEDDAGDRKTGDGENRRGILVEFGFGWFDSGDRNLISGFPHGDQERQQV